jgi:phosphoribosylformylglycinamidine synthase
VTVPQDKRKDFEKLMSGLPYALIGETIAEPTLYIKGLNGKIILSANILELKKAWQAPFANW